jgi:hypothetical protein
MVSALADDLSIDTPTQSPLMRLSLIPLQAIAMNTIIIEACRHR